MNESIRTGQFPKQEHLAKALNRAKQANGRLHLLGLVSDGGVHSHINHLYALLEAAKAAGIKETYVDFFGDGRDTSPKSGAGYMEQVLAKMKQLGYGKLGTVVGRYYAMDRDKRWERVKVAVDALTLGTGEKGGSDPVQDIKNRYQKEETDEFLKPIVYNGEEGRVQGKNPQLWLIADNDTLIFFNYRSDRMREIVSTFAKIDDKKFGLCPLIKDNEVTIPKSINITTMSK
jgi:2,3-bisphosphoglycerate-independent phosphoglycerate mutase